ncbi:MAG: phasin family protein [Betaproteobacteria bacterium]|nr:phasin family protein [Betaproteobacteria bacterium]
MLKQAKAKARAESKSKGRSGTASPKGAAPSHDTVSDLSKTVLDSSRHIWLAGLGAFSKAQAGGRKVFDTLVQQGEALARALSKLGVHTQSDVERLSERVDALSDAVNELIKATGVTPPKPRRGSSPMSKMMKGAVSTAARTATGAVDVATKTAKRTARTASGAVGAATKTAKRTVRTARKVVKGALG